MLFILAAAITFTATAADAVRAALADVQAVVAGDPEAGPFIRYIWSQHPSPETHRAVVMALNTAVSHASYPLQPTVLHDGALYRLDLRILAPKADDLARLIPLWDRMARQDKHFYFDSQQKVKVEPFRHTDGLTYQYRWQTVFSFGGHVIPTDVSQLIGLTLTSHPIVRSEQFCITTTSQLDGGLYYEFANIRKSPNKDETDLEFFLSQFGVDRKTIERLRADRKAAVLISGVIGSPRGIWLAQGPLGVVAVSEDIVDANGDPNAHPIRTLLNPKVDAFEVIVIRANGFCAFALFNGKGELQDSVPDNITRDDKIVAPGTARLQPAISCIRCHAPDEGFRAARNDVADLRKFAAESGLKFDLLGQNGKINDIDQLDRLAGLYRGDFTLLERGRDDYSTAVFRAVAATVEECSLALGNLDNEYLRGKISPLVACRELGIELTEDGTDETAAAILRKLLPPVPDQSGLLLEDPMIGFLKMGRSITRADFDEIYIDMATRAAITFLTEKTNERKPISAPLPGGAAAAGRAGAGRRLLPATAP